MKRKPHTPEDEWIVACDVAAILAVLAVLGVLAIAGLEWLAGR